MRIDEQLKISESQQKDKDGPTVSPAVTEDSVTSYGGRGGGGEGGKS